MVDKLVSVVLNQADLPPGFASVQSLVDQWTPEERAKLEADIARPVIELVSALVGRRASGSHVNLEQVHQDLGVNVLQLVGVDKAQLTRLVQDAIFRPQCQHPDLFELCRFLQEIETENPDEDENVPTADTRSETENDHTLDRRWSYKSWQREQASPYFDSRPVQLRRKGRGHYIGSRT